MCVWGGWVGVCVGAGSDVENGDQGSDSMAGAGGGEVIVVVVGSLEV